MFCVGGTISVSSFVYLIVFVCLVWCGKKIIFGRLNGWAKAQWRDSGNWSELAADNAISQEKDLKLGLDRVLCGSEIRDNKSIPIC